MSKTITLGIAGIAVAFAMLASGYLAGRHQPAVAGGDPQVIAANQGTTNRLAVEEIVRDYLLKNPEILLEVQQALQDRQEEQQRVASLDTINQARENIFRADHDGVVGNPDGKITIVEFYDYNCGFCKRAQEDMVELTNSNPDLRFVLKEFPILGPDSQKAHVVSMAFRKLMPDKFRAFHDKLLVGSGRATEDTAIRIAVSLGADEAALREGMKDPAIGRAFEETYELANRLAITGTPSYVVGNEVVFGALGKDVLSEKIAAATAACTGSVC
ncbi:MAG: DsbA family protein [Rhizobiaceae bacterium]